MTLAGVGEKLVELTKGSSIDTDQLGGISGRSGRSGKSGKSGRSAKSAKFGKSGKGLAGTGADLGLLSFAVLASLGGFVVGGVLRRR